MMIFKCKKFAGKVLPNTLYAVYYNDKKNIISFVEKQNGVDEDYVNVRFTLEEGQYGIFANEYHPGHVQIHLDNMLNTTYYDYKEEGAY